MAKSDDINGRPIDEYLKSLEARADLQPDASRARARLRDRHVQAARTARRRWIAVSVTVVTCGLLALPWPRAAAQRLLKQLSLNRVEVVDVGRADLPDSVPKIFTMEPGPWNEEPAASLEAAVRRAGFRPLLPPTGTWGSPTLTTIDTVTLSTPTLRVAEIERALAVAGVSGVAVPRDWDGTTLVAEGGPVVVASYPNLTLIQASPFRMTTPAAFQFGQFMEIGFRVFGRSADEARALGQTLAENPALVMHFPERGPVREVRLQTGGRGLLVGNAQECTFLFWNTNDRLFIVSAEVLTEGQAAELANSVR
jgi:hypothetical protein